MRLQQSTARSRVPSLDNRSITRTALRSERHSQNLYYPTGVDSALHLKLSTLWSLALN